MQNNRDSSDLTYYKQKVGLAYRYYMYTWWWYSAPINGIPRTDGYETTWIASWVRDEHLITHWQVSKNFTYIRLELPKIVTSVHETQPPRFLGYRQLSTFNIHVSMMFGFRGPSQQTFDVPFFNSADHDGVVPLTESKVYLARILSSTSNHNIQLQIWTRQRD